MREHFICESEAIKWKRDMIHLPTFVEVLASRGFRKNVYFTLNSRCFNTNNKCEIMMLDVPYKLAAENFIIF